jgi:hypothetical protein
MAKIIKNISQNNLTLGGIIINANSEYICQDQTEANKFALDDNFISHLVNNNVKVYSDTNLISGNASALSFLKDDIRDSDGAMLVRSRAFTNSDGFRFRGASFIDTVTAQTTKDIDYKITQERYINGGKLMVNNIGPDDKITFQVVDKDNVLGYGAGVVLDEFIKDFYLPQNESLHVQLDYPAKIYAGLYLRLKYTNTNLADSITIKCNLYLHWKAV